MFPKKPMQQIANELAIPFLAHQQHRKNEEPRQVETR
jgi:hypothetical protein